MTTIGVRPADRNIDGILQYMRDYIHVRAQQAVRINTRIAGIIDDIIWAQLENLRQVLEKQKMFGPERLRVGDILASDDDQKKKALFSHSDQNSIIFEIINKRDEKKAAMSELDIHDLRTLFRSLDPSLENIISLIQHWILWDLPDASELYHFDEQIRRLNTLRHTTITDDLRGKYHAVLKQKSDEHTTDADIARFELRRLELTMNRFCTRRVEEEPYMNIIRRDEVAGSAANRAIQELATLISKLEKAESTGADGLPELAAEFAGSMGLPAEELTTDRIVDYLKRGVADGRRQLEIQLMEDRSQGEPFNYKKMHATQLRERYAAELERCAEVLKVGGEVEGASTTPPAAPPHASV